MQRRRLTRRLVLPFLVVTLGALLLLALLTVSRLQSAEAGRQEASLLRALKAAAPAYAQTFADLLAGTTSSSPAGMQPLADLCTVTATDIEARVAAISRTGVAVRDRAAAGPLPAVTSLDAVRRAMDGQTVTGPDASADQPDAHVAIAVPVRKNGVVVGVLYATTPRRGNGKLTGAVLGDMAAWIPLIMVGVFVLASFAARRLLQPFAAMRASVERLASGDLGARLPRTDIEELHGIVEAINHMAEQLQERIKELVRRHTDEQAVFSSMVEGVIAVNDDQRVLSLNNAAAAMLGTTTDTAEGRSYFEVVRNASLQRFVARALEARRPIEADVILHGGAQDTCLQAHGTALLEPVHGADMNDSGVRALARHRGAVIVLNDVTRLRQLEQMRREFVANVSHELRTPITSIIGSAETLLDGALDSRADAKRFVEMISRHGQRLNAIIDDLMQLSRLEQEGSAGLERQKVRLQPLLKKEVDLCQQRTDEHTIELACEPPDLEIEATPRLLGQAIHNLLDNAIKYSPGGGAIRVEAANSGNGHVTIAICDGGLGIRPEHLARLFERFYRVDKGRSRRVGGTGLGLAIVKHIVQAHGGRVEVDSEYGHGSTFTLHLPTQPPDSPDRSARLFPLEAATPTAARG